MTIKERNWLSPMGLVKQLYRPVEEMSLLPGWLLKWTGRSSGPVNWGLFGENKKSAPSFIVTPLKATSHELGSYFSNGGDEFPLICTLAHPLHGSAL